MIGSRALLRVASTAASALVVVAAVLPATTAGAEPAGQTRALGRSGTVAGVVPKPALTWHRCDGTYRCATLKVPVDYSDPKGPTVPLAVVEQPSTNPHPLGDLLMNPGGPGGSGVQFLEGTPFPGALRHAFNLVSWDPRGVNESEGVQCVGSAGLRALIAEDPAPSTPAQVRSLVASTKSFDNACLKNSPPDLLRHMSTIDTVRDLDQLRAALAQPKLDYLGFSYGTFIGETYAHMYPARVRVMVLDGVVDPSLGYRAVARDQAIGFETDLHDFFKWCSTDKVCGTQLPVGAEAAYRQLISELENGHKLWANLKAQYGGRQRVTVGVAETAVLGSLYSDQSWPFLAQAIATALSGDGSDLAAAAYSFEGLQDNGQFADLTAANTATNCLDQAYPRSVAPYQSLASQLQKGSPDFGAAMAWGDLGCAYWPIPAQGREAPASSPIGRSLLLIGSTDDPATPYRWAVNVSKQLGARLLTRKGPGHTGYLYSTCVQKWADQYLITKRLPPGGTVCPSSS
ncbi:MAG TPA: alpha/beta hydrolase [Acidimicrobiales bacterium]|nr:alpha/beta hydrolase [Acidimicrobiales bacterium]